MARNWASGSAGSPRLRWVDCTSVYRNDASDQQIALGRSRLCRVCHYVRGLGGLQSVRQRRRGQSLRMEAGRSNRRCIDAPHFDDPQFVHETGGARERSNRIQRHSLRLVVHLPASDRRLRSGRGDRPRSGCGHAAVPNSGTGVAALRRAVADRSTCSRWRH